MLGHVHGLYWGSEGRLYQIFVWQLKLPTTAGTCFTSCMGCNTFLFIIYCFILFSVDRTGDSVSWYLHRECETAIRLD